MNNRTIAATTIAILAATLPGVAHAYVGPGAGLSLAAAFWAILVAVGTIMVFTLMWPIRRMLRRRGSPGPQKARSQAEASSDPARMAHGGGRHGS